MGEDGNESDSSVLSVLDYGGNENEESTDQDKDQMEEENSKTCQPVVDFILKICGVEKRELLEARLKTLGVSTLSDLEVIDLKESFVDTLTPVEIGKLQRDYKQINENQCKNQTTPGREVIDFNKVFNHNQLNQLNGPLRLQHYEVIDLTKAVGDHLYLNLSKVTINLCSRVAQLLLKKFPKALSTKEKSVDEQSLTSQIRNRVRYRQKLKIKNQRKLADRQSLLELHQFSKRQCHGLDANRDLPAEFPPGEDKDSQEEKRLKMIKMHSTGSVNWASVKQLMEETYAAQRLTINGLQSMDKILEEWPYIGKFNIIKAHFYKLMDIDPKTVQERLNDIMPQIIKFLTAEANKGRKGNAAEYSKAIRNVIKAYEAVKEKTAELEFVCVFLGLSAKLDVNLSSFIRYFPDTASYDEINASKSLPKNGKPCVAVLGDDLMQSPECFVLVDNTIISRLPVGPLKAILCAFMSYFVFKITYPKNLYPLLNFLERDVFNIMVEGASTRVEREKNSKGVWLGSPTALAAKYVSLKRQLQDYLDLW